MKLENLFVHCFAEPLPDGQWQAFSIELGLAAQADTAEEVVAKLDAMIADYIKEALTVDRAHAYQLLSRKAPLSIRARFRLYQLLSKLRLQGNARRVFRDPLPMLPAGC